MSRLRATAKRLKWPRLSQAFQQWWLRWDAGRRAVELAERVRREAGLVDEASALQRELALAHAAFEVRLRRAEEDKEIALSRLRVELTGSAEERLAVERERERDARVELLRRLTPERRRIMCALPPPASHRRPSVLTRV